MSRRLTAGAAACAIACACAAAAAQPAGGDRPAQPPGEPPPGPPPPAPGEPQPGQPPSEPAAPAPAEPAPAPTEPAPAPTPAPTVSEPVFAPPTPAASAGGDDDDGEIGDQLIGGQLGLAAGGRTTPGGLRVTAHYLYQLSSEDWFDGTASFTFGGGGAACFRDRSDDVICDHGLASGGAIELTAAVRRMLAPQGRFRPFARVGAGLALVRFTGDDLTGLAIPLLHAGAGLRAHAAPGVAVVALADAMLGLAAFGGGVGGEPQAGLAITVGAEVRLR